MYYKELSFKIKHNAKIGNEPILDIFFKSWIDNLCNNEVRYEHIMYDWNDTYKVYFDKEEDAVAVMLRGIPEEFQNYLEITKN